MRRIVGLVAVTLVIASVALALHSTAEARTLSTKCQPWPSCRTTAPTPTPVPTPTPTATPPPGVDPFAAWTPPPHTLSYNGDQPYPYADEPQPAPRVYLVRELADLSWAWTCCPWIQSDWRRATKSLGEDDDLDRVWLGYLAPGETAAIRAPICADAVPYDFAKTCGGVVGFVMWFASSDPNVHGTLTTPNAGSFPFHVLPTAEHQEAIMRNCHATRGDETTNPDGTPLALFYQGGGWCGQGTKYPDISGSHYGYITNTGPSYAPIIIRLWAHGSGWQFQTHFGPSEDWDLDLQPVDAPRIIDPRPPYPAPPVYDWDGYTVDGALGDRWDGPRNVVPDYPR